MSDATPISPGTILWMELPERRPPGREQVGRRPCVVLSDPGSLQKTRFPVLVVAPLTGARHLAPGPLYVRLEEGAGGLPRASTVLLDQLAALDASRVRGYLGQLEARDYGTIEQGLRAMFRL